MRLFMRSICIAVPLACLSAPALGQTAPAPAQPQIPRELSDPALVGRLTEAMQALSKAFLDMPVGEVEAAVEGRQPTETDKRRTVRSETRMSERELKQQIAEARPHLEAGMKAMAAALPAMMKGLSEAQRELEKATANVPRPDYPKR
jgi:hypothetical protein